MIERVKKWRVKFWVFYVVWCVVGLGELYGLSLLFDAPVDPFLALLVPVIPVGALWYVRTYPEQAKELVARAREYVRNDDNRD